MQVAVDALQVEDDGLSGLQPVTDLLGVVEPLGSITCTRVAGIGIGVTVADDAAAAVRAGPAFARGGCG